ncbi:hypothetical protein NCU00270 [Neurospora crassa OR74A]|uniref:DUF7729 domain-containing protein n=1 Tax=Neurospora crassa (strain ATCC 24698 / 74-OR23-1A / CBS 708.71 / DSM 1257 / FGSC 987) TaxID=367110 RepID=Q7RZU3_NEUCR|nr:hypothetical protein NCU00270 [Neurospora crassa OR74A]EAA28505.2 hypothetical protein NCU00270 [Neurospora crassa OR74A]|eukprot:XP_957741.2 hypothetical protein NCU00270 [Neurospora crassa OR74A]
MIMYSFTSRSSQKTQWVVVTLVVLLCLVSQVTARALAIEIKDDLSDSIDFNNAPLDIDTSEPPTIDEGEWILLSPEEAELKHGGLRKREEKEITSVASGSVTTTFQIAVSTVTEKPTGTTSTFTAARAEETAAVSSSLPKFFDGSLSANFGPNSNCPAFLNSFLNNQTFNQCYPISLLMQGSQSFFQAQRSLVSLTRVLDASCSPNANFCTSYLSSLASDLISDANCGAEFRAGHTVVRDAYVAMIAYAPVRSATCLKDTTTTTSSSSSSSSSSSEVVEGYCYANAVMNFTNPSSVYVYHLALNVSLPGSTVPTCDGCLRETMQVYHAAAADRKQPVAGVYVQAAKMVNVVCGVGFANETLPEEIVSSSTSGGGAAVTLGSRKLGVVVVPVLTTVVAGLVWLI